MSTLVRTFELQQPVQVKYGQSDPVKGIIAEEVTITPEMIIEAAQTLDEAIGRPGDKYYIVEFDDGSRRPFLADYLEPIPVLN